MSIESTNIPKQPTHQTTPSKNHLITQSAAVQRHNQSFDDTATNNNNQQNNAGSGYEEIPDTFSPVPSTSAQPYRPQPNQPQGGGFNNMPSTAFQV